MLAVNSWILLQRSGYLMRSDCTGHDHRSLFHSVSVKWRLGTADCGPGVKCRLRTADYGPGVKCRLSVKCRRLTESKTQVGCKMQNEDCKLLKHLCSFFLKYTRRFLVEVHCTFARSFNEHPNNLRLRTLICNTFIEGHPNFLQNVFLCCWNDLLPILSVQDFGSAAFIEG